MAIVVPSPESAKNLPVALSEKQLIVAETLLDVLSQHPHSRVLLWATLFILQVIGLPQTVVATWFGCSTRNVRHINQQVHSICRGDGKTGRPPKAETMPLEAVPPVIGYSAYAGLWLLLPGLLTSRLLQSSQLLTFLMPVAGLAPWQWVLTVLVLAWLGFSRLQHLRDLCDVGVALFTGHSKVLDADRLGTCQTPLTFKPEGQKKKETIWVPTILIVDETKLFDEDRKDKYVAAFFGTLDLLPGLQAQVYPSRQEHELADRDIIHALGFDALPKGYVKRSPDRPLNDSAQETVLETKNIFLLSWLRLWAYNRVTQFLAHLPEAYRRLTVVTAARKFLRRPGSLLLEKDSLVVRLDPFPDQAALSDYIAWINERRLAIPWLSGLVLRIEIADKPAAQTAPPTKWRRLLSAPT